MTHPLAIRVAAMLLCAAASSSYASGYYVSCSGNDAGGGTTTAPWATMAKANVSAVSGDTVYLARNCTFRETLYVKSGVTYTAYGSGLKPIISGSVPVGGLTWVTAANRTKCNPTDKEPTGDIPAGDVYVTCVESVIGSNKIEQLYLNGVRLPRARMPNIGEGAYAVYNSAGKPSSRFLKVRALEPTTGDRLPLNDTPLDSSHPEKSVIPAGKDVAGAVAFIRTAESDIFKYNVKGWYTQPTSPTDPKSPANTLEVNQTSITLGILDPGSQNTAFTLPYAITSKSGYWLENKLWMLDAPGEWYFDETSKLLYVWSPTGGSPRGKTMYAAVNDAGIVAINATGFRIQGIEIRETRRDAIAIQDGSNGAIVQVDVLRPGQRGIAISGGSGYSIQYSTVTDSIQSGIWLGDTRRQDTYTKLSLNTTIQNTTVKNAGRDQFANAGMVLGVGTKVLNSVVQNSSGGGMIVARNSTISGNLVQNSCMDVTDCGGIYVTQPPADPAKYAAAAGTAAAASVVTTSNNSILNNQVVGGPASPDGINGTGDNNRGIYLDDYANGNTVTGNYVTGMTYGLMLHTAWNNQLNDNLLIGNRLFNLRLQEDLVDTKTHHYIDNNQDQNIKYQGWMKGNQINHNAMVASKSVSNPTDAIPNMAQSAEVWQGIAPTKNLAAFDLNQYATLNPNRSDILIYNWGTDLAGMPADMTLANWRLLGKDANGAFLPYASARGAWGAYNPVNGPASKTVDCTTLGLSSPCGSFTNLLSGASVTLPTTLAPGKAIILVN